MARCTLLACGSFNPITNMHLRMFDVARHYLKTKKDIEVVKGVISPTNDNYAVYKPSLSPAFHRIAMIKLALGDSNYDWIVCNDWETTQKDWIKTLPALQHYSTIYGKDIKLLCGADLLESFLVPNLWLDEHIEDIIKTYGIVVIPRKGSNPWKLLYESDKAPIFQRHISQISIIEDITTTDISSTLVREAVKRGEPIDQLVHREVANYIRNQNLYKY